MDAFRLQLVYELSVGDLQPIGILFISIACFFCNFSYLSSTYMAHSGEKQQRICNGQCNVFNLKYTSYVHRIIIKKLNCLR